MLSKFKKSEGGRETWFYNFMPRLLESDPSFDLDVLGYQSNESAKEYESVFGRYGDRVNFHFLKLSAGKIPLFFKMWRSIHSMRKLKEAKAYDFIIAMGIFELIMVLSSNYNGKKIVWLRGIFLHEKAGKYPKFMHAFLKKLELMLLKKADYIFTNGYDIKAFYDGAGLKINVILNGVDLIKWKPNRKEIELKEPIKVVYVGRLSAVKGFLEFIASANQTLEEFPESFEFHVVGAGELKDSLEFKTRNPKIIYHGSKENDTLPSFLSTFHVCVALTMADENGGGGGTSNALLEQMALGLTIVAWDNVIFRQVLAEDEAYLVEQKNIIALKNAYVDILCHPDNASLKARNVLKKAGTFGIDAKVEEYNRYFLKPKAQYDD